MATILIFTNIPDSGTKEAIITANGEYEAVISPDCHFWLKTQGLGLATIIQKIGTMERHLVPNYDNGVSEWLVDAGSKITITISNMPTGGERIIQYAKIKQTIN